MWVERIHTTNALSMERLNGEVVHYPYKDISHQLLTIDTYSDIVSDELFRKNSAFPLLKMLFKTPVKFFETYVYGLGFLDGLPGFVISVLSSYYIFIKCSKLWEKRKDTRVTSTQTVLQVVSRVTTLRNQ